MARTLVIAGTAFNFEPIGPWCDSFYYTGTDGRTGYVCVDGTWDEDLAYAMAERLTRPSVTRPV